MRRLALSGAGRGSPGRQHTALHAALLSRTVMGNVVVDHERITRNFPEGKGSIEMLGVYEVRGSRISKATFSLGPKTMSLEATNAA